MNLINKLFDLPIFKDKNFSELIKGSFSALSLKFLSMVIGYITMLYITNNYGAKQYGLYSLALTLLSISIIIPRFGLDTSLVKMIGELKINSTKDQVLKVFIKSLKISIVLGILLSLIYFFFSESLAINFFNKPSFKKEISLIGLIIVPASLIFLIASYFQAFKNIVNYILINSTLINVVFLALLLLLHLFNKQLSLFKIYSISIWLTFFIGIILLFLNIKSLRINYKNKTTTSKYSYKKIINTSFPMMLSSSFALLINWLDVIMLGIFTIEKSVGIYAASQRLAAISGIALFAINAISTPKFVEFYTKNDIKGLENIVIKSTKLIFFTTTPILLIFLIFPKTILSFNGPEFTSGYLALIFICLGKFVNSISGSVGYILQMTNNQKTFQNVLMIAIILNVILNLILIPKFDFNGAAFASFVTISFLNIALVIIIKRKLGFWTIYIPFVKRS
jgi:O-antigen/teichoic acid export membrane protein